MKIRIFPAIVVVLVLGRIGFGFQKESSMIQEFFNAVTQGNTVAVKEMLAVNSSLARVKDEKGVSAILKATYYDKKDIVALLLPLQPDLNIFEAAATGQTARMRALLARDPTLANAFSADGFMPLGLAVFFGHPETVEALLNFGAEVNASTREAMKVTPLHSAAAARQLPIARVLINHGANVNATAAEGGFTPLHEAAANGDIEFAKLLLEHGAEINATMGDGKSPLAYAIDRRQTAMEAFLRARGAR